MGGGGLLNRVDTCGQLTAKLYVYSHREIDVVMRFSIRVGNMVLWGEKKVE